MASARNETFCSLLMRFDAFLQPFCSLFTASLQPLCSLFDHLLPGSKSVAFFSKKFFSTSEKLLLPEDQSNNSYVVLFKQKQID